MELIAKKYTILVGEEPITIWAKNGKVKKALFMDKKVPFELSKEALDIIKNQPSKIVNGAVLKDNEDFTRATSKMFNQQLKTAMQKNDKVVMSRFARSDLIPDELRDEFIQTINRPRGLRGLVVNIINKTNLAIQKLSAKIDRYFDRLNDNFANQKLDKYLQNYQTRALNKMVQTYEMPDEVIDKPVVTRLAELAQDFINNNWDTWNMNNQLRKYDSAFKPHQEKLAEFIEIANKKGYTSFEAQAAFLQQMNYAQLSRNAIDTFHTNTHLMQELKKYEKLAQKNETLVDFEIIAKDLSPMDRLDILAENKEYLQSSPQKQQELEEKYLYQDENIKERAIEIKEIATKIEQSNIKPLKFNKDEIEKEWKIAQAESRSHIAPTKKFMDYSALKFNGVDMNSLNNWQKQMDEMRAKGKQVPSDKKVQEFINGTLKNAKRLEKEGYLKEVEPNRFLFKNEEAKDRLYTNLKAKEQTIDIKHRVQDISSEKSFEKLIKSDGTIDVEKLSAYAQKLSEIAQIAQSQNQVTITADEIKKDTQMVKSQTQSKNQENVR